jgi:hypothetical protein
MGDRTEVSLKDCPKCGIKHSKPGKFCSRKCANSRQWTDDNKKLFSIRQAEYMAREESEEHRKLKAFAMEMKHKANKMNKGEDAEDPENIMTHIDDYFLVAPRDDFDSKFIEDGDFWEEV